MAENATAATAAITAAATPTATGYWMRRAWLPDGVAERVRVEVLDGTVASVVADVDPRSGDTVLDGTVLPGAANCHSHAFHRALRGAGAPGDTFWGWRKTMYRIASRLDPDSYLRLARSLYAEMLAAGYTSVAEFHYVHHQPDGTPYQDPNIMGLALKQAAREVGIRLTLLDTCYLSSGFGAAPEGVQNRFSDGDAAGWAERINPIPDDDMFRLGAAVHSVRAVPREQLATVSDWARQRDTVLHVHLSEQEAENEACLQHTGLTPTGLLREAGAWTPKSVAVHAVHLTDDDVRILADDGATVCVCPSTEADLSDGIAPVLRLADAGVPMCIGSDENVLIDPFREVRSAEMHERLRSRRRENLAPRDLVAMLSGAGQPAAGWPEAGRIAVGSLADWVEVDDSSLQLTGVLPDRIPQTATAAQVRRVFVGGDLVAEDGVVPGVEDPCDGLDSIIGKLRS
ncbi:formimidoylglutamate deiminase [Corynebacterium neomassiliense]|uniref:formimidoylglutamate deiminase n=1 Tax=Corynebacterium neomassiliense TaxID=2079482 RepID=UPI00102F92E3|nr:formimidoylglutamate deiminase [Corynebacterium neomassiliense]